MSPYASRQHGVNDKSTPICPYPPGALWEGACDRVKMEPFVLFGVFGVFLVLQSFLVQLEANPCDEANCLVSCCFFCFAGILGCFELLKLKFTICPFRPPE